MKKRRYYKGRRISKGEKRISQFLDSHNIEYIREKTFKTCISPMGNCLRFDFYLEQFNLLIEYQGHHHEKPINKYQRAKIVHEKTVTHDGIKKEFVLDNQINLIEILYKDYETVEVILTDLFKEIENDLNCKILI
jgi:very-short-patch-repair endonuclease